MLNLLATLLLAAAPVAAAPANKIAYAPPAAWVRPPPSPTDAATPPEAPFRFIYNDQQVRLGPDGEELFTAYRVRILKPEALTLGQVGVVWNPSGGTATIHWLRVVRGAETIDVLKDQKLQVLQREGGLEQNALDGQLTAALQTPGLRVGDELEFAFTVRHRDPTVGEHFFGLNALPPTGMPGAFRLMLSWPKAHAITHRATRDLPAAVPSEADGLTTIAYELRDPATAIVNDGAPARFNVRRLLEYTDFADWQGVSSRFGQLYTEASALAPGGALRNETAKIAKASGDPLLRAQAALQLVQDQVRYVYVGLNGGNYRPASADETWQRRFGDCKGKTSMLLAVLRELGIEAEAVLVNPRLDNGLDDRLPSPAVFNHVLVRAKVKGRSYWLDGTRVGDRDLRRLPPPEFRWALALRRTGAPLEAVPVEAPSRPQRVEMVEIDASAGPEQPAKVKAEHVLRGDEAVGARTGLTTLSAEDARRAVRDYWRERMAWVDSENVAWRYDEHLGTLVLALTGSGKPEWKGDAKNGWRLDIPGAGFFAPDLRRRPREQDRTAPWTTNFPRYTCYATTIRLPASSPNMRWLLYADPVNRVLGGTEYWRASGMKKDVVRTVMSSRVIVPEITAAEATITNDASPGFNNNVSNVYEGIASQSAAADVRELPFGDAVDWSADDLPACSAPAGLRPR
jgi:hypothetical protein